MTNIEKPADYEEVVIKGVKNDFFLKTHKYIKIIECNKWESEANFSFNARFETVVKMVFDCTGWKWKDVYNGPFDHLKRKSERVYRRGVIDYIAVNNGSSLMACGKVTNRDHSTVIHSLAAYENRLETEKFVKQAFMEITDFCRTNYHLYKDKKITIEQLISGEEGDLLSN